MSSKIEVSPINNGFLDVFNSEGDANQFVHKFDDHLKKIWEVEPNFAKVRPEFANVPFDAKFTNGNEGTTHLLINRLNLLENTKHDKQEFMKNVADLFQFDFLEKIIPLSKKVFIPLFDKENNCFRNIEFKGNFVAKSKLDIFNLINATLPDTSFKSELEPNKRYFKEVTSLLYDETQKSTDKTSLLANYLSFLHSCKRAQFIYLTFMISDRPLFNLQVPSGRPRPFGVEESNELKYDIIGHPNVTGICRSDKFAYEVLVKDLTKRPASEPPQHTNFELKFTDEQLF